MKRISIYMAAVSFIFCACNKEAEPQTPEKPEIDPLELVEMTFDASAKTTTKTSLNDDGTVSWSIGDKMNFIYEVDGTAGVAISEPLTAEAIKADGSAEITVQVPAAFLSEDFSGTRRLSAVYPSDATAGYENGELIVTVPEIQDGLFSHADICTATWSGSNYLTFKNICGILQLDIDNTAAKTAVLESKGKKLTTLNIAGAGTYYAALLPGNIEGFTITVTDEKGEKLAHRSTTNILSLARAQVAKLGLIAGFDDRLYVCPEGKGRKDGSNWDNAADLAGLKALIAAETVTDVYMTAGIYSVEEALASESAATVLNVYGGYPADAEGCSTASRDITANVTVFDGGGKSRIFQISGGTVAFDGMTFRNAFCNSDNGGAMAFTGETVKAGLKNCTFTENKVTEGLDGTKGLSGGAVCILAGAELTVENCHFSGNYGRNGGSLFTNGGSTVLTVRNCDFTKDFTYNTGGSINNSNGTQTIENCTFTGCYNFIGTGGAVHVNGTAAVQKIIGCTFTGCEANRNSSYTTVDSKACGGAISVQNAYLDIDGCVFDGNMGSAGSAILIQSGDGLIRINGSIFKNNKGASRGLIQTNGKAALFMNNCSIFDNTMRTNQWGTVIHGGNPSIVCMNNCTIYNNTSIQEGGNSVCLNNDGFLVVVNTTVVNSNAKSLCRSNNNTSSGTFGYYDNCMLANSDAAGLVFYKENNSSIKTFNCVVGKTASTATGDWLTMTQTTSDATLSLCEGASFDSVKGLYMWNGPEEAFTKTDEKAIAERVRALGGNNGNTRVGGDFAPKFVEWVESLGGFTKDQAGNVRTASGTWPGSLELK